MWAVLCWEVGVLGVNCEQPSSFFQSLCVVLPKRVMLFALDRSKLCLQMCSY